MSKNDSIVDLSNTTAEEVLDTYSKIASKIIEIYQDENKEKNLKTKKLIPKN